MKIVSKGMGVLVVVLSVFLVSCSTGKLVVEGQHQAEQLAAEGNYQAATDEWNKYITERVAKGDEVAAADYAKAAKTALKADQKNLAEKWFGLANYGGYSDPEMELAMANIYKARNETPKEMTVLERYRTKYPTGEAIADVNGRLFEIYAKLKDDQNAIASWNRLSPEQQKEAEYLAAYFKVMLRDGSAAEKEQVASQLIQVDPKNVSALEWLGETLYRRAEESYQAEMKAYEKTHTHMQYLHLTQELKVINGNFQKSLDCFTKLWDIEQKKSYATYLTNIYTRFDNKAKADYYRKFL